MYYDNIKDIDIVQAKDVYKKITNGRWVGRAEGMTTAYIVQMYRHAYDTIENDRKVLVYIGWNHRMNLDVQRTVMHLAEEDNLLHSYYTGSQIQFKNGNIILFVTPDRIECKTKGYKIDKLFVDCDEYLIRDEDYFYLRYLETRILSGF